MTAWAHLLQPLVLVTGVLGMWMLVNADSRRKRVCAYIVLLGGQPLWIGITIGAQQWGMLVMAVAYTIVFSRGIYREIRESRL